MLQRFRESIGRWVAGAIIALIAITFVFWGVDFGLTGSTSAARVNGEDISLNEFENEVQNQLIQYQQMYNVDIDEALRIEIRRNVLEEMIATRALQQRVDSAGYRVSDARVSNFIRATPAFQVDGQFSMDIYRAQLRFQGYSPTAFEEQQRGRLALLELRNGMVDSTFYTPAEFRRFIEISNQSRQIGYAMFEVERFLDQVEVIGEEVAAHYEENRALYRSEEAVDLEYIELLASAIEAGIEVTEEELRSYYDREARRFRTDEERRARHILVNVAGDGDAAAQARAAEILARIEAGEDFAQVARETSDDAGTRAQGGDLGWITEGMLADAFEEALYAMEVGEVRGPVRTNFGYHLIRLDDVRPGDVQPFEAVSEELREEYLRDRVEGEFIARANELADRAFDAYDDLASVADQMGLPLMTLEGFSRSGDPAAFPNSAPVVRAAFSPEQLEERLNSSLVELSPEHVLVLRVAEHHPPEELPLEEVREQIEEELARRRAEQLAQEAAGAFLAALTADEGVLEEAVDAAPPEPEQAVEADGGEQEGEAPEDVPAGEEAAETVQAEAAADAEQDAPAARSESAAEPTRAAALAEAHGGVWSELRWVQRFDNGVPTEVLSTAFNLAKPAEEEVLRERVFLASGDQAVLVLSSVRPGIPASIPQAQRDGLQRELAEQAALIELAAYAEAVREQARVRVPDDVLEDPDLVF